MRGAADRLQRDREAVMFGAWAGEMVRIGVENDGKLRPFKHYLNKTLPRAKGRQPKVDLLAAFESLRVAGVPMTIRKVVSP